MDPWNCDGSGALDSWEKCETSPSKHGESCCCMWGSHTSYQVTHKLCDITYIQSFQNIRPFFKIKKKLPELLRDNNEGNPLLLSNKRTLYSRPVSCISQNNRIKSLEKEYRNPVHSISSNPLRTVPDMIDPSRTPHRRQQSQPGDPLQASWSW